jgi:methionine-rich copper-binding protein CopC
LDLPHLIRTIGNNICDIYRSDTINAFAYDSLIAFQSRQPGIKDQYILAATYLENGDYTNMQTVLDNIDGVFELETKEETEYQNNLITFAIAKDIADNDLNPGDLSETQVLSLESMVNLNSVIDFSMAQALLSWNNPDYISEELILEEQQNSARMASSQTKTPIEESVLKVFPNPTKDYFTLQYHTEIEQFDNLILIIADMNGRTIRTIKLENTSNDMLVDIQDLKAGVYSISLYAANVLIEVERLTVIK